MTESTWRRSRKKPETSWAAEVVGPYEARGMGTDKMELPLKFERQLRAVSAKLFLKAVLEGDGAVEDQMAGGGVAVIQAEVALAHELEAGGILASLGHRE